MFWEIFLLLLLIVANGAFSMAEIALFSSRKARLQKRAELGDEGSRQALELANSPNEFLSTVQIGITLIGVLAGAFGGATVAENLGEQLNAIPAIAPHGKVAAFAIVVTLITYLSLVIGELVPKRLALTHPEQIASRMARPMKALSRLASPMVRLLSWSTDAGVKILGVKPSAEPPISEDEIKGLIEQGLGAGVFHLAEKEMLESVFRLDRQTVGEIMTPGTRIVWLDLDDPPEANWRKIVTSGHSRFPVYQGNRDNVMGAATVKALWANSAVMGAVDLRSVLFQPTIVPESMKALKLVETFRKTGQHFALIADEFGSVQGLVTLHDVVEALVGLLPEKGQRNQPTARHREDGSWIIDAAMEIVDAKRVLKIKKLPGEGNSEFVSLGGFIIYQLGRIPAEGDKVVSSGFVFEVIDMDHQRIDKILVSRLASQKQAKA
jgi:putative hemolysin